MIKTNKPLEWRIEKSFDFFYDNGNINYINNIIPKVVRKECPGFDLLLYCNSKLCLSPHDYYHLGDYEKNVKRDLKRSVVKTFYSKMIEKIVKSLEMEKVYHIREVAIGGQGFKYSRYPHVELAKRRYKFKNYKELFILDKNDELRAEIIKRFWARKYPKNIYADKYSGNDLSIYFTDDHKKFWRQLKKYSLEKGNEEMLKNVSIVTISNLNYGYRMRIESSNAAIREKILKTINFSFL